MSTGAVAAEQSRPSGTSRSGSGSRTTSSPATSGAGRSSSRSGSSSRLLADGAELRHARQLHEPHHADGRDVPARLRRRLRPPHRRDRPLDRVRQRDRRGDRRQAAAPDGRRPGVVLCIAAAILATTAIGALQGSFVAQIGVPSFVVTLAGFLIWQGVIQVTVPRRDRDPGRHDQQRVELLLRRAAGWIMAAIVSVAYVGRDARQRDLAAAARDHAARSGPAVRVSSSWRSPVIAFGTVTILNKDRGVPFALLLVVGAPASCGRSSPSGRRSGGTSTRSGATRRPRAVPGSTSLASASSSS